MANHNFIDLSGQTFNWVFVENRAENGSGGIAMWNCLCLKCGNRFIASGKNIRNGNTKSCGCYRKEKSRNRKFEDLTGLTFNYLFVNGLHKRDDNGQSIWKCTCKCNSTVYVKTNALKSGRTKSCGCYSREMTTKRNIVDIKEKQFAWLIPREIVGKQNHKGMLWLCDCVRCGGTVVANAHDIISGGITSCGCLKSKGEQIIADFLDKNKITYQRQKKFVGCRNKNQLLFDFYLSDYNIAIEYDGEFHYKDGNGFSDLKYQQNNDKIKDQYCEDNEIQLLRIPYWERDNIESILKETLLL